MVVTATLRGARGGLPGGGILLLGDAMERPVLPEPYRTVGHQAADAAGVLAEKLSKLPDPLSGGFHGHDGQEISHFPESGRPAS